MRLLLPGQSMLWRFSSPQAAQHSPCLQSLPAVKLHNTPVINCLQSLAALLRTWLSSQRLHDKTQRAAPPPSTLLVSHPARTAGACANPPASPATLSALSSSLVTRCPQRAASSLRCCCRATLSTAWRLTSDSSVSGSASPSSPVVRGS